MVERYNSHGPYVPAEPTFNERADRDSEEQAPIKPKNILAAIMGNPKAMQEMTPNVPKDLDFDEGMYDKFQREAKRVEDEEDPEGKNKTEARKRHNPLGDFKFRRINELF